MLTTTVTIPFPLDPGVFTAILTVLVFLFFLKLAKRVLGDAMFIVIIIIAGALLLAIYGVLRWLHALP